jgi:hypothetical protein
VRAEFRFAHEVAQTGAAAQAAGAMDQFPHRPRLSAALRRRKLA